MYPRVNYEMSDEDLDIILTACKPTTAMMIGGILPRTPQENANAAWANLGKKMGFDSYTVKPIQGKSNKHFSAMPLETAEQKTEREFNEQKDRKWATIKQLQNEIKVLQDKVSRLLTEVNNGD